MLSIQILCLVLLCNAFVGLSQDLNPIGLRLLEQQECGNYRLQLSREDGIEVSLGSRPWMVQILTINGEYICGGTLISDRFVLTAAFCSTYEAYSVRLGEHNIATDPDCIKLGNKTKCVPPSENVDIERIIAHPYFKAKAFEYNIALIELARKVVFKEHISPICLPVNSTLQQKLESLENVFLTGWGLDGSSSRSELGNVLRETSLQYSHAKQEECFNVIPSSKQLFSAKDTICAIHDKFLCRDTLGSPFSSSIEYVGKKRFVQFGIISVGVRNCNNTPVISTNIFSHMPWITYILAGQQDKVELNPAGVRLLEQQECGQYDESKIFVDGAEVALGSRPWMARIQTKIGGYLCDGTLISDRFVLTAAHCATNEEIYSVRLGEHNIATNPDCNRLSNHCLPFYENVEIGRIITHAYFEDNKFEYDIALIKLARKVDFKGHISPICLPVNSTLQQQLASLENGFLTGWGQDVNSSQSQVSNVLRETKLEYSYAKQSECFANFSVKGQIFVLNQICAMPVRFFCFASSGSPFFSSAEYFGKKRFVQFGVVFFGIECNKAPVLITNILNFLGWITNILADEQE